MYGFENFKDKEGYYCFHAGTKSKGRTDRNKRRPCSWESQQQVSDLKEAQKECLCGNRVDFLCK